MPVTITFADSSTLVIDGVLRQGHERRNEVTKHPVETGSDISDNIRSEPGLVTIEGVISYSPLPGAQDDSNPNRHKAAFEQLTKAAAARQPIAIATGLANYSNMAIESLSAPREPKTGYDLYFTLSAREIVFATTQTTTVSKDALGAKSDTGAGVLSTQRNALKTVSKGVKPIVPLAGQGSQGDHTTHVKQTARVKTTTSTKPQSWALRGVNYVLGH